MRSMIRFGVLGPVVMRRADALVSVGPPMVRHLLAVLLSEPGQPVAVTRLVDELWPEGAPATAHKTLQGYVHRLRNVLADPSMVRHTHDAYALGLDPNDLDAAQFTDLSQRGSSAFNAGRPDEAANCFRAAIALWRGEAYADVPHGYLIANEVRSLEDGRLLVRDQWAAADLDCGRHGEVAAALPALVEEYPYHESLRAHLMIALYRSGRQAEALELYRRTRHLLAEQLGVEPGPRLQQLHRAMLAGDDALLGTVDRLTAVVSARPEQGQLDTPRELPPEVSGFVGREEELRALSEMLAPDSRTSLCAIGGTAGAGKTALAVRWAHAVAGQFPDGQLFIDLRGFSSAPPLRPVEALAVLLHSLGISSDRIPLAEAAAAAMFRSRMAHRRMLILLDNAASAEQVRPLLPGGSDSLVLVTSRHRLAGLVARDGARYVQVDMLQPEQAAALLVRLLGQSRTQNSSAVAALATACGYLPLALRIAAAQLIYHPQRTVSEHVLALRDDRIEGLSVPDDEGSAVRSVFDRSYDALAEPDQRVFQLLGLIPGEDFDTLGVAALARTGTVDARRSLHRLVAAHLVSGHDDRYRLHDLLREYAAGLASAAGAGKELEHLVQWYLDQVNAAASVAYPTVVRLSYPDSPSAFNDRSAALAWLQVEQANVVATVRAAAAIGLDELATRLADGMRGYLYMVRASHELLAIGEAALAAAVRICDAKAEAALRVACGQALMMMDQPGPAAAHVHTAVALSERASWWQGHALALVMLCRLDLRTDRLQEMVAHSQLALAAYDRAGERTGQAIALGWLGLAHLLTGDLRASLAAQRQATEVHHASHGRFDRATTLTNIAETLHLLGRSDEALDHIEEALNIFADMGHPVDEAATQTCLAMVYRDTGRMAEAAVAATRAREMCAEADDLTHRIGAEHVRATIATAEGIDQKITARQAFAEALRLAGGFTMRHPEADIRTSLANALRREGRPREAAAEARRALSLAEAGGYRLIEAKASRILAKCVAELGQHADAQNYADRATGLFGLTGGVPTDDH
jgi:DNA-binding SARP family transcriptional activator